MKRRLRRLLTGLLVVLLVGGFGVTWLLRKRMSPEELVRQLEATRNCRAEIEATEVHVFSWPASLEIRGFRMVPRDEVVEAGTALAERKPVQVAETMIAADRLVLEVDLWRLLVGELAVRRLVLDRPDIRGVRAKKGAKSLDLMLGKPVPVVAAVVPVAAAAVVPAGEAEKPEKAGEEAVPEVPFKASDLPFAATLEEVRIRNGSWTVRNDRKRTFTEVRDFNAAVTGVRVDPANLAAANEAMVSAGGRIVIDNQQLSVRTLDVILTMDGRLQPFDAATGMWNNDLVLECTARKGSVVNRIPTLVRLAERLEKLKSDIGLAIELPAEGVLTKDTPLKATVSAGRLVVAENVLFPFDTYRIRLDKDSWLAFGDEQHVFDGRLQASTEVSRKALEGVTTFFAGKDSKLAEIVNKNVLSKILTDKRLLSIPFQSTGEIGHPDVDFSPKFRESLNGAMKDVAKDLLLDAASGGDALKGAVDTLLNGFLKNAKKDAAGEKPGK